MEHKPRKYRVTNESKGLVFVKEIRKSLAPGEKREFDGIILDGTKRLEEKGILKVEDIGEAEGINRFQKELLDLEQTEKRRKDISRQVLQKVGKLQAEDEKKKVSKVKVEAVKANDPIDEVPTVEERPTPKEIAAEAEAKVEEAKAEQPQKRRGRPPRSQTE